MYLEFTNPTFENASEFHQTFTLEAMMVASPLVQDEDVARALANDKNCARVMAQGLRPANGDLVGVRLNLNVLKSQKVALQTVHRGNASGNHRRGMGFYNGTALWYEKAVTLRDAHFNVSQKGREQIAGGSTSKFPIASVDGEYVRDAEMNLAGIAIRFNPREVHLFVTEDNRPIRWAEEVTVHGHRVYARGRIEYYTKESAPAKVGASASAVKFA